ncbi:uncharacterized protein Dvir_GJ22224, isoform C [Drosophila virilis]|uniref:N-terminal E2 ubiquitin-conjugating enzyme n=1 Tax=Drosophila virilis TaxID=7244 RepID=A0A0Q9WFV1_DROVI|nr:uncharacterized protein Dvir_GJ22224, isoform C [Drosophila virilis]
MCTGIDPFGFRFSFMQPIAMRQLLTVYVALFVYISVRLGRFLFTLCKQALVRQRHLSILCCCCCCLFASYLTTLPPSVLFTALLCPYILPAISLTQFEKLVAYAHFARFFLLRFRRRFHSVLADTRIRTRAFAFRFSLCCSVRFGSAPANSHLRKGLHDLHALNIASALQKQNKNQTKQNQIRFKNQKCRECFVLTCNKMLKLFKKTKDKIPKSEIINEPKEPQKPAISKCGKPLLLDNSRWERRLHKELMSLIKEPPPGVTVDTESVQQNLSEWKINIKGFEGTLYEGEDFQLLFKFNNKYPFDSPEVTFIGSNIPVHPHVYSNGHICLSILTEDWSPALSVQSVCLSIASMLSSCREKKRPPDNTLYVKTCNKNPKKTKWWYHDDSV